MDVLCRSEIKTETAKVGNVVEKRMEAKLEYYRKRGSVKLIAAVGCGCELVNTKENKCGGRAR